MNDNTGTATEDRWCSTEEVAAMLGLDPSTLRRWRTHEPIQGPPFSRLSPRLTLYNVSDVRAWLAARRIDPGRAA